MKKLAILAASLMLSAQAYAGSFGVGATIGSVNVEADGKEVTDAGTVTGGAANTTKHSASNNAAVASFYAEYVSDYLNGLTIGYELTPGTADVSDKVNSRTETAQGASGTNADGSVTYKAQAEIENIQSIYLELPIGPNGFFLKGGYTTFDLNTLEVTPTNSGAYKNATGIDGMTGGFGMKHVMDNGMVLKGVLEYTDYDTITLKSATVNTITADLETTSAKFSLGYQF